VTPSAHSHHLAANRSPARQRFFGSGLLPQTMEPHFEAVKLATHAGGVAGW